MEKGEGFDPSAIEQQLSAREKMLRAIDAKISQDPFYTKTYEGVIGIATPIDKGEAIEMFAGTNIVLTSPELSYWARNLEILGRYIGTDVLQEDLGVGYQITGSQVQQIIKKTRNNFPHSDSQIHEKPYRLIHDRADVSNENSNLSAIIGKAFGSTADQQGPRPSVSRRRVQRLLNKLDLKLTFPPIDTNRKSPFYINLEQLENPDLAIGTKRDLMTKILHKHYVSDRNLLHVASLSSVGTKAGLYFSGREVGRLITSLRALPGVFVHSIPISTKGRCIGIHRLIANGDIEKAVANLRQDPELSDLRIPSVEVLGKEIEGDPPNTTALRKGLQTGRYIGGVSTIMGAQLSQQLRSGQITINIAVGKNCPGSIFKERSGGISTRSEEAEILKEYFKKRTQELLHNTQLV